MRRRKNPYPLRGHHLRVDPGNVDPGEQARLVVRLHDVPPDRSARAGGTVVGALRARVAAGRPAERPLGVGVEKGVLLLDPEPGLLGGGLLHGGGGGGAGVGGDGLEFA